MNAAAADAERLRLKRAWPDEFADGERYAFLQRFDGERERGGYVPRARRTRPT